MSIALFAFAPAGLAAAAVEHGGGSSGKVKPKKPKVTNLNAVVSASGEGLKVQTKRGAVLGHKMIFSGTTPAKDAGASVELEARKTLVKKDTPWTTAATVTVSDARTYSGSWTLTDAGQFDVRAVLLPSTATTSGTGGGGLGGGPQIHTGSLTVEFFQSAVATIYGQGLWGNHTACGQTLTRGTIGVATLSSATAKLKCGTKVAIEYHGRELMARVIDRGAENPTASWDLTMATAKALGIDTTSSIATLAPAPK